MRRGIPTQPVAERDEQAMQDGVLASQETAGAGRFLTGEDPGPGRNRRPYRSTTSGAWAIVTSGLFRMRFTFPAVAQVRMNARSPSTAILTGVFTGVRRAEASLAERSVAGQRRERRGDASRTSAMAG